MPHVSWSEIKAFRTCMHRHHLRYRERLTPKHKPPGLLRGSVLHEMLDAFSQHKRIKNHKGPDPWDILEKYEEKYRSLFSEERERYGDFINDCTQLFTNYLKYYRKDPLIYEESETFIATDIAENLRFIGYIDKVALDSHDRRWLVDHKFVKTIPNAEDQFSELQLLMYVWAWNRFNPGRPIAGIIWDYVRTKLPVKPEVLKNGGLSQRKNMDTTRATYLKEIKAQKLPIENYTEMLDQLEGKEDKFYTRVQLPRPSDTMISHIVSDFRASALMIQKLKGIAPRNMNSFNCKGCEYRPLCEAEIRGLDVAFIRKSKFVNRDDEKEVDHASEESED